MEPYPDRVKIGASAIYVSLDSIASSLGADVDDVRNGLLGVLELPLVNFPGNPKKYVLLYALETKMFELGLPNEMRGSIDLIRLNQELAGVLYGATSKEVVKQRVQELAYALGYGNRPKRKRKTKVKRDDD